MNVLPLVKKLFPFNYSITGQGNDNAIPQYLSELDFDVHEYASGQSLNGWFIPHSWHIKKAKIYHENKVVYDAGLSPLGLATLSPSYTGKLSLNELQAHLTSSKELPDAVLYQWKNLYRPREVTWGISIPHRERIKLEDVEYRIEIETKSTPSTMKVLDYLLPGESKDTLVINGHNCHPFQANDDISGCAVAIRVMQALQKRATLKPFKYSYRLLIAPELHGPMFWLNDMDQEEQSKIKGCILLKSVGNKAAMRLQNSYLGNQPLDAAAEFTFKNKYINFDQGGFRSIYGNDETVFEAPPYNIPCISLTRWPFSEYHSDLDIPELLSEQHLQDCVDTVINIIENYEVIGNKTLPNKNKKHSNSLFYSKEISNDKFNQCYKINFNGLVCLSAYGLYKSIPEVSNTGVDYNSINGRWNKLMNCLPREIDDDMTVNDLSIKYDLPRQEIYEYLREWVENKLLIPANYWKRPV